MSLPTSGHLPQIATSIAYEGLEAVPGYPMELGLGMNAFSMEAPYQLPMGLPFAEFQGEFQGDRFQAFPGASSQDALGIAHQNQVAGPWPSDQEAPSQVAMEATAALEEMNSTEGPSKSIVRRRRRQRAAARGPVREQPERAEEAHDSQVEVEDEDSRARRQLDFLLSDASSAGSALRQLAFADKAGSRAVQLALRGKDAPVIAAAFHGHVRQAMRSMFANYVIQLIVEVMPNSRTSFVAKELIGVGAEAARHRFGCRILCRILEHGSMDDPSTALLLDEVLQDAAGLSWHPFGNYVVRHCLEYGLEEHRMQVARALSSNLEAYAKHPFGSRVVETALQFCQMQDQLEIVMALSRSTERLAELACDQCGCHVVKALLRMPGELGQRVERCLQPAAEQLWKSRYGKHVAGVLDRLSDQLAVH